MFEGFVASILNRWLGKYVQDLDTEQLNVGIFSGEVKLNNLRLKPDALFETDLPIEVKLGTIGELCLFIPWSGLSRQQSIVINIEDVFIVAVPAGSLSYDGEKEKRLLRSAKKKVLSDLEGDGLFSNGLFDGLLSTLSNNIQLYIRNVHVRFEDLTVAKGLACGVCIHGLSLETTNSKWKPSPVSSNASTVFQLAKLEAVSVYYNCGVGEEQSVKENTWVSDMKIALQVFNIRGHELDFILKPLSAKLKVIVSRSSEARVPKLLVDLVVQDAAGQLSRTQLLSMISLRDSFRRINIKRKYFNIRPTCGVSANAALWWKYAYKASLDQRVLSYTWSRIKEHRDNYHEYKRLYKLAALNPGDTELRLDLSRAEDNLSLCSIVMAREQAKIDLKLEDPDRIEIVTEDERWWSLSNGNSNIRFKIKPDKPRGFLSQLSKPEQKRLNELLGRTDGDIPIEKAKQYIEHKFNLTLNNISLSLYTRGQEIASVNLTRFLGSVETRPAANAFKISARAESLIVEGASVENGLVPILSSDNVLGNSSANFLSVDFEKNPLTFEADYGLDINLEPLEIVYHENAISELISFFQGVGFADIDFKSLTLQWIDRVANLKAMIESRLMRVSINGNIKAPHIVIPETGSLQKAGMVVVLALGKWNIRSDLQAGVLSEDATQMEMEERLYDRLHINIDGIQLMFSDSGDEWRDSFKHDDTEYHLLSKVRGQIVFSSSVKPEYRLLPRTKLNLSVATIKLNLSDRKIATFLDFVEGLPLPAPRNILIAPPYVKSIFENDQVQPEPCFHVLSKIQNLVVSAELAQQRTPDEPRSMPMLGTLDVDRSWASLEASDEEVELWARTLDLPGFDDNVSPNNVITSLMRVVIGELVISLSRSSDHADKSYLMARVSKFCFDVAFMLYGPAVQATLGGIQLIDKLHIGPSGEYLEIASSNSDVDFVSLLYRKVRSDCPDFKTHFHSVEQSLVCDLGVLSLSIHREAVITLTKYHQYIFQKIISREMWWLLPGIKWFKECIPTESSDPPIPPGATKFSYSLRLAELRIKMCNTDYELLEFKIAGLESDCMFKANERMVLLVYLNSLTVDDLSEVTLYPKLVFLEEDKVLELKYVRHSPRVYRSGLCSSEENVKSDGSLKITLGRLNVVFIYTIIVDLQHFLEPLLPIGLVWKVMNSTRRLFTQQLDQLRGLSTRLHLAISLNLPSLLLPQKASSPNLVVLNCGEFNVENFFKEVANSQNVIDNILLKLDNVTLSRALMTLTGCLVMQEAVLEPTSLKFDIKRFVGVIGSCPTPRALFDINGNLDPLKIAIGQRDLSTFLSIWADNFTEGKLFENNGWFRACSPLDVKSPTESDDPLVKKLQVFLSHGETCRKEATVRFNVDSITLTLYNDIDEVLSSPVRDLNHAVCRLTLWETNISMERAFDSSMEMKMALQSCLLEDIRPDPNVFIKKVFQSHHSGERKLDSTISVSTPPIVDMTFKQTQAGDRCIDILIEKIRLNLSVPFLISLGRFLIDSVPVEKSEGGFINHGYVGDGFTPQVKVVEPAKLNRPPSSADSTSGYYSSGLSCLAEEQTGLSVSLQLRKPEVLIFATGERKGYAILFRCEILADWSRHPGRDALVFSLAGLQAMLRPLPVILKSKQSPSMILQSCDVEIARSMKYADEGLKVTLGLSPIDLTLSVSTFATIADIVKEFNASLVCEDRVQKQTSTTFNNDYEDLWSPKKIPPFMDNTSGIVVCEQLLTEQHSFPVGKPTESLTVVVPKVKITIEAEHGSYRRPLIVATAFFTLTAQDWNSLLNCKGNLEIQASYLNESVGAWEPLIEPCGVEENVYRPFEIVIQIFQGKSFPISPRAETRKDHVTGRGEKQTRSKEDSDDSETSGDEDDAHGMTFLRKRKSDSKVHSQRPIGRVGCMDSSDSEDDEGILDKLTTAVGRLFTGENSDGDVSEFEDSSVAGDDDEIDTEEDESTSARSTVQQRAVFLKKHSDSIDSGLETEAVDRLATHILIHTKERLELNVTPSLLRVVEELTDALSGAPSIPAQGLPLPISINNHVGPGAVVSLLAKGTSNKTEDVVMVTRYDKSNSVPSSPNSVASFSSRSSTDSETDFELFERAYNTQKSASSPNQTFPIESVAELYKRISDQHLLIQLPGFEDLKVVAPKQAGCKLHTLQPCLNQTRYHLVLKTEIKFGRKKYSLQSPLTIKNETSYAMGIYYNKSALESLGIDSVGEVTNPFEDATRLTVIEPDDVYHVPLFVAYHCKIYVLPPHVNYHISNVGLSWQDLAADATGTVRDVNCLAKEENDNTVFAVRVLSEENIRLSCSPRYLPNYKIRLLAPLAVYNRLPYALEIKIPSIKYEVRIESGDKTNIYFLNLQKQPKITVEIPEYLGIPWTGTFNLTNDVEEKIITMATEQDTEGGNKHLGLSINITRESTVKIFFHSQYWIINKTGLPFQLRGSLSDVVFEAHAEEPLLFNYRKQRKRCVRLRVFNSSWSSAFSLDTSGCSGLVVCKDKERRKIYRILVQTRLSTLSPQLTKIITFLPNFIVTNECRKHLRFMEENEKADLWTDLAPGQCLPFWPETDSMKMYIKFRDSKLISQHFPFSNTHTTVLRMDKGCGLTVEVAGGTDDPFSIKFRSYAPGDAPIRIDNQCEDLFLKLHQKDLGQVALLSPYQSLMYTWDDPTKERELVWNVYNSKGQEFKVPMDRDGCGEERVSFHIVRQTVQSTNKMDESSSSSDDSEVEGEEEQVKNQLSNKTRKDKVVVYWASYIDKWQRVLLLTQDERTIRQVRRTTEAERSQLECFLSIAGVGVSVSMERETGQIRELAYCSITDSAAQWEVSVAHRWKVFALELACWLEERYKQGVSKAQIKDYVHVDFDQFLMTKPFFGEIRRRHRPGVWLQYRRSEHMSLLRLQVHRLQIDNQLQECVYPTVFYPSTSSKPCAELAILKKRSMSSNTIYKFVKVILQKYCLQLERGWLIDVWNIVKVWLSEEQVTKKMRKDIAAIHLPISTITNKCHNSNINGNMIEYLHLSPVNLEISLSSNGPELPIVTDSSSLIDNILSTILPALSDVKGVEIKLPYKEIRGVSSKIEDVKKEALRHYRTKLIQQLHVLLMGVDVLTNSNDFADHTSDEDGLYELKSESLGIPEEFAEGLNCGALCLLGHESGGPAGAASLLAASLGTTLQAVMPSHDDANKRRRCSLDPVSDLPESLLETSKRFSSGCLFGITGVVIKPSSPAQNGIEGFLRGSGKGLMKLIVKPSGGLTDCLAVARDGIKRAMEAGENLTCRVRPPRYMNSVLGVRPFAEYEAIGLAILNSISRGHYIDDHYWSHAVLNKDGRQIMLITLEHIFLLEKAKSWYIYEPVWTAGLEDIMSVPYIESNKLIFKLKQEEKMSALWSGEEKCAASDDLDVLKWLQIKVESVLIIHMEDNPCV